MHPHVFVVHVDENTGPRQDEEGTQDEEGIQDEEGTQDEEEEDEKYFVTNSFNIFKLHSNLNIKFYFFLLQ